MDSPRRLARATSAYENKRVGLLLERITEHFGEAHMTLKSLAKDFGVSAHYLGVLFRRVTGITFHSNLRHVRIFAAAKMLETSGETIKGIAAQVGYNDTSNFGHDFKAILGLSPGQFRQHVASGYRGRR